MNEGMQLTESQQVWVRTQVQDYFGTISCAAGTQLEVVCHVDQCEWTFTTLYTDVRAKEERAIDAMTIHLAHAHPRLAKELTDAAFAQPVHAGAPDLFAVEDEQPESVLAEADRIINGPRRDSYGPALESFERIAALWSPVLGKEITAEEVALCMVQLKVARYLQGRDRDSAVDMAGYSGLLDVMARQRAEREHP